MVASAGYQKTLRNCGEHHKTMVPDNDWNKGSGIDSSNAHSSNYWQLPRVEGKRVWGEDFKQIKLSVFVIAISTGMICRSCLEFRAKKLQSFPVEQVEIELEI